MSFFSAMFDEIGARRRRLRAIFGDRGQALTEFLTMAGLVLGSLGLFVRPWMAATAPWGFVVPFGFLAGYVLIEARRQRSAKTGDSEAVARSYDWGALLWSLACALLGVAAFVIAWSAGPPVEEWTPPPSAVSIDMAP